MVCTALSCMFDTLATILARDFPNTYTVLSSVYVRMANKVGEGGVMRSCSSLAESMHGETCTSLKQVELLEQVYVPDLSLLPSGAQKPRQGSTLNHESLSSFITILTH